jgi:[acyl-carrier-protein] S-malonyltransferase
VFRCVFLFAGQGAQVVGMGRDLYERYPEARDVFDAADRELGFPLSRLCFEGPAEELSRTENTQPAILTVSLAILRVLERHGVRPDCALGLSLGEYGAHVAAGSLAFPEVVSLVRDRGRYMQEAVPEGEGGLLAVIGLSAEAVEEACRRVQAGVAEPANFNCPGQVVVGGDRAGLAAVQEELLRLGARRVVPLDVSAPFHTSLLTPAAERLARRLETVAVRRPAIPVVANRTARPTPADAVRELLVEQVNHPVRMEESLRWVLDQGVERFVEVGPGRVLSGFVRKLDRNVPVHATDSVEALESLLAAVGEVC